MTLCTQVLVSLGVEGILCNEEMLIKDQSMQELPKKIVRTLPSKCHVASQSLRTFFSLSSLQSAHSCPLDIGLAVQTSSFCSCWSLCLEHLLTSVPAESFLIPQTLSEHLLGARFWTGPCGTRMSKAQNCQGLSALTRATCKQFFSTQGARWSDRCTGSSREEWFYSQQSSRVCSASHPVLSRLCS